VHFQARVGFHAPAEVRTAPGRKMMAARGIPEKTKQLTHSVAPAEGDAHRSAFLSAGKTGSGCLVCGNLEQSAAAENRNQLTGRGLRVTGAKPGDLGFAYGDLEGVRGAIEQLRNVVGSDVGDEVAELIRLENHGLPRVGGLFLWTRRQE